jgi:predicted  nucleic acid-binding Zn-ribbon protein
MVMAVMAPTPRESWSDQRLDELNKKVDGGFVGVEKRIDKLETKVDALGGRVGKLETRFEALEGKVDEGFNRLDRDMRELRGEIKNLPRGLFAAAVAIVVALIGCSATLAGIAFL